MKIGLKSDVKLRSNAESPTFSSKFAKVRPKPPSLPPTPPRKNSLKINGKIEPTSRQKREKKKCWAECGTFFFAPLLIEALLTSSTSSLSREGPPRVPFGAHFKRRWKADWGWQYFSEKSAGLEASCFMLSRWTPLYERRTYVFADCQEPKVWKITGFNSGHRFLHSPLILKRSIWHVHSVWSITNNRSKVEIVAMLRHVYHS